VTQRFRDRRFGESRLEEARQGVESARHALEQVKRSLLRPSSKAFESSVPILESAVVALRRVEATVGSAAEAAKPPIRLEIGLLRRELSRVNALAENAARLYQARAQLLTFEDNCASNYTPTGTPASTHNDRTVILHG
jgi:hypothetical protein